MFAGVHVEIPRNWEALMNYCKKEETRKEGTTPVEFTNDIPTKFTYLEQVANEICDLDCVDLEDSTDILKCVQAQVAIDIQKGKKGIEWIASNPDWKVVWKQFGKSIILRARIAQTDRQTDAKEEALRQEDEENNAFRDQEAYDLMMRNRQGLGEFNSWLKYNPDGLLQ